MSSAPLTLEQIYEQQEMAATLQEQGMTRGEIAEKMDTSFDSVKRRLQGYRKRQKNNAKRDAAPEGVKSAVESAGLDFSTAKHGWRVIQHEDGSRDSVFWKSEESPEELADALRNALEGMQAIKPVPTPSDTNADLLTTYKLADVHIGMMAWGKETGEDYDTSIACERVRRWISHCVDQSPASDTALILDVGDLNHADDQKNMTPGSGHILDVDTRHFRTLDMTIQTIAAAVEIALTKHRHVKVRIMRGNHNPNSYIAVMFALAERYRDEPRVEVIKDPMDFFVLQWGKVMIGAHHGDRAKAQNLVLHMADAFPSIWGSTLFRYLYTGHLHHHKSQDIGGVTWEQLRAVTAKDAYAAGYPFSARAEMQATTYHKQRGAVSTQRVANWLDG